MPFVPIAPPQPVPSPGGFDYVVTDSARGRVYAAHKGGEALLVVDGKSGKVLGQVRVGPMHGSAVEAASGNVFTGNGDALTVSLVDPVASKVVRSAKVPAAVDALAYDAATGHVYADEDNGTRIFVLDGKTLEPIGTVTLPGHKPEYLAVDPKTHVLYQNIADHSEFVVIDPQTLRVVKTIETPELKNNHPLRYDAQYGEVLVGGKNGVLSAYTPAGKLLGSAKMEPGVDECDLNQKTHVMACAGNGFVTFLRATKGGAPVLVSRLKVAADTGAVAFDQSNGNVWIAWTDGKTDYVQGFTGSP